MRRQVPRTEDVYARLMGYRRVGEDDATFARRLGWSPQLFSNYKRNENALSLEKLLAALAAIGAPADYVVFGEGEPDRPPSPTEAQQAVQEIERILARLRTTSADGDRPDALERAAEAARRPRPPGGRRGAGSG